jgi:hypothetical protein
VPRFHEVTAVTASRPRYSIFGWFLKPGRIYPLRLSETDQREHEDDGVAQETDVKDAPRRKDKKKAEQNADGDVKDRDKEAVKRCKLAQRILRGSSQLE